MGNIIQKITHGGILKAVRSLLTTSKTVTEPGLYAADAKSVKDLQDEVDELTESSFGTSVTITTTQYTVPSDGYFIGDSGNINVGYVNMYVNNRHICTPVSNPTYGHMVTSIYVRKGMTIHAQGYSGGSATFIPIQ